MNLTKIRHVHFVGVGGIGMSSLAQMFLLEGKRVSGSDMSSSKTTKALAKLGATIHFSHAAGNVAEGVDLVIYTIAASPDNPELIEAKRRNIPALSYPELLGVVSEDKYTIAVSGTHGKTTTTAMIASILIEAKLDPTVIVGSFLMDQQTNFIAGKSNYLVVEACEYRRSFLNIHPDIIVITNIDNDHLDYYKDMTDIQSAFRQFIGNLSSDGVLICDPHSPQIHPVIKDVSIKIVDYTSYPSIPLSVPGSHNVLNSKAAQAVAEVMDIQSEVTCSALLKFKGTWRRFEYKGKMKEGALVYDDYGHHPTEIRATVSAAVTAFPDKKIVVVFQPHLYSRTKLLLPQFIESLKTADAVFLLPIYAAREKFDSSVSSEMISKLMSKSHTAAFYCADVHTAVKKMQELFSGTDNLIITIGAGNVYKVGDLLLN